jgi:hypothetical protein
LRVAMLKNIFRGGQGSAEVSQIPAFWSPIPDRRLGRKQQNTA